MTSFLCTHCGMPLTGAIAVWNDEPDRDPFCSGDCMTAEQTAAFLDAVHRRP